MYNVNNNAKTMQQRGQGLTERAPLLNDENSSLGVGLPRVYRNTKSREVLGELPRPSSMDIDSNKLNVLSDVTSHIQQQRKRPLRNSKVSVIFFLFAFGHKAQIYFVKNRKPQSRYIASYFIFLFSSTMELFFIFNSR